MAEVTRAFCADALQALESCGSDIEENILLQAAVSEAKSLCKGALSLLLQKPSDDHYAAFNQLLEAKSGNALLLAQAMRKEASYQLKYSRLAQMQVAIVEHTT